MDSPRTPLPLRRTTPASSCRRHPTPPAATHLWHTSTRLAHKTRLFPDAPRQPWTVSKPTTSTCLVTTAEVSPSRSRSRLVAITVHPPVCQPRLSSAHAHPLLCRLGQTFWMCQSAHRATLVYRRVPTPIRLFSLSARLRPGPVPPSSDVPSSLPPIPCRSACHGARRSCLIACKIQLMVPTSNMTRPKTSSHPG